MHTYHACLNDFAEHASYSVDMTLNNIFCHRLFVEKQKNLNKKYIPLGSKLLTCTDPFLIYNP